MSAATVEPLNFYVSPDGNDNYSGMLARNDRFKGDGPFMTVGHARDVVRGLRRAQGGPLPRPINITLRGGTYWLNYPLVLTPEDSGTAAAPITYAACGDERPVLSAGRPIRGWGRTTLNGHEVWAAKLPALRDAPETFGELWVNGRRRLMARSPNQGYFRVAEVPDADQATRAQQGQNRFRFDGNDLKNWPDVRDAQVVVMSLWTDSHMPVRSVNEQDHVVECTRPSVHKISPGDKYFVEGALDLLDEPGEWCFERKTGTLYYMPMPGEEMLGSEIVIPWHQQVMRLEGRPDQGRFVEHVIVRGLTFAYSEWNLPRTAAAAIGARGPISGFGQAAVGVPGAVWGAGARNCTFDQCTVEHAGNYGIELAAGCQHDKVSRCTLTDLGAGGVKLGETRIRIAGDEQARHNEVVNCTIADCGRIFPSAIGIWLGQTGENVIAHNEIRGLWYTGISVGWTWGYGDSLAGHNTIEFNHVHHIGSPADGVEPILSDMGGIYTLGMQPGTVVRNNVFHDIAGLRYGGWGIYFDEGSTDILAERNLAYRTTHGGFHQHYGKNNIVRNNIFAFGRDAQIQRTRVEDHLSFTFERNLVYWDHGNLLAGNWSKLNVSFDHNTYWHAGDKNFKFADRSWDQWQAAGMDGHSQIADPLFVDPEHNDFQLRPGAVDKLLGFVPFNPAEAGPRPAGAAGRNKPGS